MRNEIQQLLGARVMTECEKYLPPNAKWEVEGGNVQGVTRKYHKEGNGMEGKVYLKSRS